MKKKIIRFIIFVAVFLLIGIIFWKKINEKSEEEIFQEKVEQFYENQESFEKIVAYVSGYNYHQITENNKMWTDVIINGVTFRLEEWRNNYTLSLYSRKELLSQLLNDDEYTSFINVIGEESRMEICYDKKSYTVKFIIFTIYDTRIENVMASLIWHNPQSDYETLTSWVYPLNANWLIECMGLDKVK